MRTIYISAEADQRLMQYFRDRGYKVAEISTSGIVSGPVSCHPDMFMCRLGISDDAPLVSFMDLMQRCSEHTSSSEGECYRPGLSPGYPAEVAFNAACTGRFFIHNTKYTDTFLLSEAQRLGMRIINVRQGYAKCSIVIVDEESIITYDRGIASKCLNAGMNVLTVSPGHMVLDGYGSGFIGGTSGRIGNTVYFYGDLSAHPDCDAIVHFIEERGHEVKWFREWPLTDIGSIL